VKKAAIPDAMPESMESAKAGLAMMSSRIVVPAETDLYNELVKDVPRMNNTTMVGMSVIDHFPKVDRGVMRSGLFIISLYKN
jgi:hypothetical protein